MIYDLVKDMDSEMMAKIIVEKVRTSYVDPISLGRQVGKDLTSAHLATQAKIFFFLAGMIDALAETSVVDERNAGTVELARQMVRPVEERVRKTKTQMGV